ncbi:MAG: hypothetical protein IJN11_05390 [Oscillospiraceae bacterium]|nr:hypothetical protein [Oscillospiraceae bacterium]
MAKVRKTNDKPNLIVRLMVRVPIVLLLIFCVVTIVVKQNSVLEKKQKIAAVEEEIQDLQLDYDELTDILKSADIGNYIEKVAMENDNYSYAYPDEHRYYDTSRD